MSARLFPIPFVALLLTGCLREELPVDPAPRGEATQLQVCMGPGYQDQLWIDLGTGTVVATNPKGAWDLAFDSKPDGWHIWLNGSKLMTAWNIGAVDITQPTDTAGMHDARRIDAPSGHPDSTAFGNAWGSGDVFVVDLGFSAFGLPLGLRKVRPEAVDADACTFTVANLDGSNVRQVVVPKDPTCGHTYFTFTNDAVVAIEPPLGTWDIVLTQYTHQFYVPYLPYIVSGVLTDPRHTRVARIPSADFDQVVLGDTLYHPFEPWRNTIGYDWKDYDFDIGAYTVFPQQVYLIEDTDGRHFKLHFLDFYGAGGQVGCPSFAVEEL